MNFQHLMDRFSTRVKYALVAAQVLSEKMNHSGIRTEHVIFGIMGESSSIGYEILSKKGLSQDQILAAIESKNLPTEAKWHPVISESLKIIIERAAVIASHFGYPFIGTEHFLYAISSSETSMAYKILTENNINCKIVEQELLAMFENATNPEGEPGDEAPKDQQPNQKQQKQKLLEYFTINLTEKASKGKIDPIIGREEEISRLITILSRKTKNNPCLVGDPGVGKTAVVEGLALRLAKKEVPEILKNKKILQLDMALLVAGSIFRGEFENRLKQLLEEVKAEANIILFIDEIHTIVGAGSAQGSLDAANILKPSLSRGEISLIGATTFTEYKKNIEDDPALERRFQPLTIKEPTEEISIKILNGIKKSYEQHHDLEISKEAILSAVKLSKRYIQDRFLPDKAIDLIDETAARLATTTVVSQNTKDKKILENELLRLEEAKTKSVLSQDFTTAIEIKTQEEILRKKLAALEILNKKNRKETLIVKSEDIAETVSIMTKIPLQRLTEGELQKLALLEQTLQSKVVGQDKAITEISKAVRRSRSGIGDKNRPIGSFIFLGPTGVGKTETAKQLAKEIYGDENALIRVDMSEFMERHNVSRLIGAPAGYVGYEDGGKLTETVRRQPYSVILFDELEKAHFEVFNILLQILEDGQITDAQGRLVNFKNTLIIMTSNFGMQEIMAMEGKIGFGTEEKKEEAETQYDKLQKELPAKLKEYFLPEFLGRIDRVIIFKPLSKQELQQVVKIQLQRLEERLLEKSLLLNYTKPCLELLSKDPNEEKNGARFIRKNIQELVEDEIADLIVSGKATDSSIIKMDTKNDKLIFKVEAKIKKKTKVATKANAR